MLMFAVRVLFSIKTAVMLPVCGTMIPDVSCCEFIVLLAIIPCCAFITVPFSMLNSLFLNIMFVVFSKSNPKYTSSELDNVLYNVDPMNPLNVLFSIMCVLL